MEDNFTYERISSCIQTDLFFKREISWKNLRKIMRKEFPDKSYKDVAISTSRGRITVTGKVKTEQ